MSFYEQKKVVITGAHSGLGKVVALDFAKEGAHTILVDRLDCDETRAEMERQGGKVIGTSICDISKEQDVIAMGKEVSAMSDNQIDVLVNVAGYNGKNACLIRNIELKNWQYTIGVNLTGTMLVCREMIPIMDKNGGAILNVSSNCARRGLPYRGDYVCSKWGLLGLTRTLALELADYHIRVNAVCPGPIVGDRIEEILQWHVEAEGVNLDTMRKSWEDVPMKRFIKPEEISAAIRFLCSDQASAMTGQALNVTGGFIMT